MPAVKVPDSLKQWTKSDSKSVPSTIPETAVEAQDSIINTTTTETPNKPTLLKNPLKVVSEKAVDVTKDFYNTTKEVAVAEKEALGQCFNELGCFHNKFPWVSLLRPFPLPMNPKEIDTKIYLYTSKNPKERYYVTLWKAISLEGSDYNPNRDYTVFITHGFSSDGNVSWVEELKDAYLEKRDANVFIVDWGKGASHWNYLQVASNTRVVGAEIKRLGQYLVETKKQDPAKIHLIGHSLGSHISSYFAKGVPGVGQLTALDPAQPGFEHCSPEVRLNKGDAKFIDVLHTNTRPVIPFLGFGLILPAGDIDYYLNGGLLQPGCRGPPLEEVKLNGIADLGKYPVEVISKWVACSHGRSYLYYTESVKNDYCSFWGKKANVVSTIADVTSLGVSGSLLQKFMDCELENCSPIGLDAPDYPARGVFMVTTHSYTPYCSSNPKLTDTMRKQKSERLRSNGKSNSQKSSVKETLTKTFSKLI